PVPRPSRSPPPTTPGGKGIAFNTPAASDTGGGFNSGTGVATIRPGSALPAITNAVIIDGYTQPGTTMNTLANDDNAVLGILLDGESTPSGGFASGTAGLTLTAGNCTVQGLVINNFMNGYGINITAGSGDHIQGNFLRINPDGLTTPLPNYPSHFGSDPVMYAGVNITSPAYDNWVGTRGDSPDSVAEQGRRIKPRPNCWRGVVPIKGWRV